VRFLSRSCRTDLAAEAHSLHHDCGELTRESGVIAREENVRGFSVTRVEILNPRGEETLGFRSAPLRIFQKPLQVLPR